MNESPDLLSRISVIEERNARVERQKAWETSLTRRLTISVLTYAIVMCVLFVIGADHPLLGALVPVLGFWLSTLSLPIIKRLWQRRYTL